jgi:hypothetical protein
MSKLTELCEKRRRSKLRRLGERYQYARQLGATGAESAILSHYSKENIEQLLKTGNEVRAICDSKR